MISIVGIGNAASAIAEKFKTQKNYNVYLLNSNIKKQSKSQFRLQNFDDPEDYEKNIPDLTEFFADINDTVQVFIMGASYSSNYCLGILQQLSHKNLQIFYIKPDTELLTGTPRLIENMTFGILQEYARSGVFESMTILSNLEIENMSPGISVKNYYESLNNTIFSTIHYLNFFTYTEPEIGLLVKPLDINRIRSIAALNMKTLEEKWLFELDAPRDMCYYLCINNERLENEAGLHKNLVNKLKKKPHNTFRRISYGIYETHLQDFGFCVAHTNAIQQQKTLDKID